MPVDTTLVRDVVVVIPGIMGSELVDSEGRLVWSVTPGMLTRAIRTLGASIRNLALEPGIGDNPPAGPKQMRATRLIGSLHVVPGLWTPITGYDGLLNFLASERFHLFDGVSGSNDCIPNLLPFPYDWRLSNRYNGKLLAQFAIPALEKWRRQPGMAAAKLVLVCHSMGGLIARWFAEKEGGAELIRAHISIGTPHRGSLNALKTLVNGMEAKLGPFALSLTDFARSLPSLYQLLPQYDCVVTDSGRTNLLRSNCANLDTAMLKDACDFHAAINSDHPPAYPLHKVIGIRQPTATTARLNGIHVIPSEAIDGKNQGGDGTVPRLAAEPFTGHGLEVHEVAGQHGELQGTRSLLDLLDGILSRQNIIWQATAAPEGFGVEMQELWSPYEDPFLRITEMNNQRLKVKVVSENGAVARDNIPVSRDGDARLGPLPEGGYSAIVSPTWQGGPRPVTKPFLVFDPTQP
jgi:pimeloyl-ACP methyl ester carboxylesterase